MNRTPPGPLKIGDWLVEPELMRISKGDEIRKLEFKTMEILLCLVANKGEVVSKKQLHDEVWGEVFVTDNVLTRGVSKLRKAFDDDHLDPAYIDTISKSGYRLIAPVELNPARPPAAPARFSTTTRRILLLALLAILVVSGLSLMSNLSRNVYSKFYDPQPVSTLLGPEMGHSISPDGQKMSFSYTEPGANNVDVYVKLLDDLSQSRFTDFTSHQAYGIWSPDGNYLAYVSVEDGTCGIYKEPVFRGEKIRIGSCFNSPEDFVWSPDGRTIAFTDVQSPQQSRRIFFLDVESQKVEEALNPEPGVWDRDPAFSPDGEYLVFRRLTGGAGSDIFKLHLTDKTLAQLSFDNARILGLDVFDDGRQIAFSSNRGGPWAMWKVPFGGGAITRLHVNDRVPTEPRFSADGRRMIYRSIRDEIRLWALEREDGAYQAPVPVAGSTRAEMQPSLSADGQKLVFLSNRTGSFEIWATDFENGNPVKLTSLEGSFVNMPTWSADGTEVLFDARLGEDNAIYLLDVASKQMRTFADLQGDQVNARYSKDGKHIYFASDHSGSWQIWKMPVSGNEADLEQVTYNGGYHLQEGPDNGVLYYARTDTSGVWRLDETTSEETLIIPALWDIDWGSWITTDKGIIYFDRSAGAQVFLQPYDSSQAPISLFVPAKRVQLANPTITATFDTGKIIMAQIESSEDEIMMVNFR